ncbi:hypothetical protein SNE40_019797 [Patella caerulea]|uniref:Uncharacterized protein n=2 Tax=Patella caerulea TaxID=87958 RepID=A0AAN8G9F6_PATCE
MCCVKSTFNYYKMKLLKNFLLLSFRTDRLKYRIKKDFPQLTFYSQPRKNLSELVYIESLPAESFMDTLQFSSTDESTCTDESDVDQQPQPIKVFDVNPKKTLFDASLIKKSLADKPGMVCPWPPTSSDLNMKSALDIVPLELFNFMSWVTGSSEEPTLSEMVNVSDDTYPKILSICQDIVYLASGGRKQTPKALSLGLTTRHLTGSSQLLTILHKLGHCSSTSTIIGFETSLAELQLATQGSIPKGFGRSIPAILVWDNIDFGEETLSGKGTTHHTNGILIQNKAMISETVKPREFSLPRGQRTLKAKSVTMFEYHLTKRHGPTDVRSDIEIDEKYFVANLKSANNLDLSFIILKYLTSSYDDHLPGWTGFNCEIDSTIFPKSAIHYMPVIEASPTDMTTVNTILIKSVSVADSFQLSNILLVFDQAIYAKAQQIRWKDPELSKRLVIRLGEFHTTMAFLAIIGKVYKDAGLQDILIESDVVAQGSINGVINGHHYNRSLRAHKLLYEALQRLRFSVFLDSLGENDAIPIQKEMTNLELAYGTKTLSEYLITEDYIILVDKFETFVSQKCKENPTFAFWSNYINLVQTVLMFIRATRQSDWTLHLSSLRCMLPWFFSYDRMNYARYAPAYWLEMMRLPISHPELDVNMFKDGNWTVHRQDNSPFSSIACDQAIEETCNGDSKTKGGIVGMTLNRGAVQRWILAQPERAAITRQCEEMSTMDKPHRKRKDLDRSRLKRDEGSICALISTIDSMINPFDNPGELVSISSGVVAGDSITKDLLSSKEKGAQALDLFMQNRLIKNPRRFLCTNQEYEIENFF